MITLTFACGHRLTAETIETAQCPTCGERRVSQTKARAPRFRGVVIGPCATYEDLPAVRVNVTKE